MRKDTFNHKMALEQTFRKTIQELDSEYRKKAFEAMSEESKNALSANTKLKEELFIQSNGVENLLQRFKAQGDEFLRMKVENEILDKGSTFRMKEIAYLKRKNHEYATRLGQATSNNAQEEREKYLIYQRKIDDLESKLKHSDAMLEKAQIRCSKWKARAVELMQRDRDSAPPPQLFEPIKKEKETIHPLPIEDPRKLWCSSLSSNDRASNLAVLKALERPKTVLSMSRCQSTPT